MEMGNTSDYKGKVHQPVVISLWENEKEQSLGVTLNAVARTGRFAQPTVTGNDSNLRFSALIILFCFIGRFQYLMTERLAPLVDRQAVAVIQQGNGQGAIDLSVVLACKHPSLMGVVLVGSLFPHLLGDMVKCSGGGSAFK